MELCSNDRLQRESIQVLRHSKTTGQIGSYSDGNTSATSSCDGATDILESLGLYRQAVPLVQPQSTAAIKTLRKMAGSSDLANRMLARNQAASRATLTDDSETANPESRSTFQAQGDGKWARKQLEFLAICEQMLLTFDSAIVRQKCIKLSRVKELLDVFELPVSDTMYRQWEQSLPAAAVTIPATAFVQACRLWFTEDFMIEHMKLRLARTRTIDSNSCSPAPESLHQRARHPFNLMAESNDAAAAFSYHDYARNPPPVRLINIFDVIAGYADQTLDCCKCRSRLDQVLRQVLQLQRSSTKSATDSDSSDRSSFVPNRNDLRTLRWLALSPRVWR